MRTEYEKLRLKYASIGFSKHDDTQIVLFVWRIAYHLVSMHSGVTAAAGSVWRAPAGVAVGGREDG